LALEDKSGDSALFEFIKGKLVIHHNRKATVMTNEPAYQIQIENIKNYAYFGGKLPLPGDMDSMSRFVRLSAFLQTLPKPSSYQEAVAFTTGVIRTAQVPFGAHDLLGEVWPTRWLTVSDLTNQIYYIHSTQNSSIAWIDLKKIPFKTLSGKLEIQLHNPLCQGEIFHLFLAK
jgi:choloylglycine hydrolase